MNAERIAEKLRERADAYEEPYGGSPDWIHTNSYPIATVLRELAIIIDADEKNPYETH